jgi:hypothetical protein
VPREGASRSGACWYDALGREFVGGFTKSNLDDVLSYEEAWATPEAAYMIGLAVGLRLNGAIGLIGGAR